MAEEYNGYTIPTNSDDPRTINAIFRALVDDIVAKAAAVGGGTDKAFYENDQTVTSDYTITSGKNAISAGPVTVNTGVVVTIPSGSVWTVV